MIVSYQYFENISASIIPVAPSAGRGFITVIMGGSGSGKTTLLKLLLKEETPSQGFISLRPADARVSYLSQEPVLFDHLSVKENARYFSWLRSTQLHFDEEVFERAARELGLSAVITRDASVNELSGGERQRIALLRALSISPSLLLLDEPCRGLDIPVRQEFLTYLRRFADELGLSIVYVTHQQTEARMLADKILFMAPSPGRNRIQILEGTLGEFTELPPHESVALTFADGPVNRVLGTLSGHQLRLLNKTFLFADESYFSIESSRQVSVLFRATQVKWGANDGVRCHSGIRTGEFLITNVGEMDGIHLSVIGPFVNGEVNRFGIDGKVLLYGKDGEFVASGTLSDSNVDDASQQ